VAVWADWIPEASALKNSPLRYEVGPDEAALGQFVVSPSFRDEFVALIQEALGGLEPWSPEIERIRCQEEAKREMHLDSLREAAEEYQRLAVAAKPTAAALVDGWQTETGFSLEELAHQAGISIATLHRIRGADFEYKTARGCESLKGLAAVLECDWQDLVPTQVIAE
jgi:DNA-binding Xre family transcriptional regulator